jgi:hypothetical protein
LDFHKGGNILQTTEYIFIVVGQYFLASWVCMGVELGSLTVREEHRLRVLRICGPNRGKVTGGGGGRKLHSEELYNLYASPNVVRVIKLKRMKWTQRVARTGNEKCIQQYGPES